MVACWSQAALSTAQGQSPAPKFTSAEIFDPADVGGLGSWSVSSALNTARAEHVATLLPSGTVIIGCGGSTTAELYNSAAGSWADTGAMSQRRAYQRALLLANGK